LDLEASKAYVYSLREGFAQKLAGRLFREPGRVNEINKPDVNFQEEPQSKTPRPGEALANVETG
jgi:hypothetical protein